MTKKTGGTFSLTVNELRYLVSYAVHSSNPTMLEQELVGKKCWILAESKV